MTNEIPKPQRALILQGGGALGAYEVGVFKRLYKKLYQKDEPLFDVVVGTSAGAINAAILTSYVKEKQTWEKSFEKLEEFWMHLSTQTPSVGKLSESLIGEKGRRYYSTKYFFYNGIDNVFSSPKKIYDKKFFDNYPFFNGMQNVKPNIQYLYENKPLKESLEHTDKNDEEFVRFPIKTSFENKEPRLLVIGVDISEGVAVAFDSYEKKEVELNQIRSSNFSRYSVYGGKFEDKTKIRLDYPQGISIKHVMASASIPIHFPYQDIQGRKFWDGSVLSNTPLRELLQAHRDYWLKNRQGEQEIVVPDLDVYMINLWPSRESPVAEDYDGLKDRRNDIAYSDKTEYDQKIAFMISDYVSLIKDLKNITNEAINEIKNDPHKRDLLEKKLREKFNENVKSLKRSKERRTYGDLMRGRFALKKVVTIERRDDNHTISDKWADFTSDTITNLINEGYNYETNSSVRILGEKVS